MNGYRIFFFITVVVAILLLATSPQLPLTWDEGESIDRASSLLRGEVWRHITEGEGHPSGYAWVIAAGRCAAPKFWGEKTQRRFGPIVLAAVACGLVAARGATLVSPLFGVFVVTFLLTTPRLFAHLHIAACDSPLVSMGLIALAVFDTKFASWWRTVLFGLVIGLAISMKFSGWLVPIPFLVFACVTMWRTRRVFVHTLLAMLIAVCVFVSLHATLWPDPFGGFVTFVTRNVTREGFNIPTLFFGRMYNLDHPLPVYNTLVWTAITLPIGHLVFAVIGGVVIVHGFLRSLTQRHEGTKEDRRCFIHRLRRFTQIFRSHLKICDHLRYLRIHLLFVPLCLRVRKKELLTRYQENRTALTPEAKTWFRIVLLSAVVPLAARAIPGTPVHDAERLFVSAFASLSILAAVGAWWVWNRGVAARIAVVVVMLVGSANLVCYAPQWLSFYGGAIGGVRGAVACGFEPTYWWDGLDAEVSDWLAANTPADGLVVFSATSQKTLALQQRFGELPQAIRAVRVARNRSEELPNCFWYVLQRRTSAMEPTDVSLTENRTPCFTKKCGGVALIEIYAGDANTMTGF
ncbi:MAG: hypothetical protein ACRC46_05905 [Thermoguttaceae bacterium]